MKALKYNCLKVILDTLQHSFRYRKWILAQEKAMMESFQIAFTAYMEGKEYTVRWYNINVALWKRS
jgi:hypothetical protein